MFHLDVAKVYLNVTYVATTIHTYFKRILHMMQFQMYIVYVTMTIQICFKHILHML
jgi:hypothetical protein